MDKNNNFNFLRLFFATLVIYSHSYPLTQKQETLHALSNGQIDFGGLAVFSFFIMSGYLIFKSLQNSKTALNFFWKRCLRIFPALFIMLLFTQVILILLYGPQLLSQKDFYTYLINNLLLFNNQYTINGVFEYNAYEKVINGSLWSLYYEWVMYLFVFAFYIIRNNKALCITLLFATYILSYLLFNFRPTTLNSVFTIFNLDSGQFYKLLCYFTAGSLLSFIDFKIINKTYIKISLVFLLALAISLNYFTYITFIFLPILILCFALSYSKYLFTITNRLGDVSYGVYIYAFFIQQILMKYYNLDTMTLIVFATIITYVISYFSWHYIEKKALKFKEIL